MKPFRAGCGRETPGPTDLHELAYTALEFPECPACRHRLEPEGRASFCRWLDPGRKDPFAALAGFREGLEEGLRERVGSRSDEDWDEQNNDAG